MNGMENKLTLLDCFCGAGIGAIGAEKAGLETILAFDNKAFAVDTYNKNLTPVAKVMDAKKIDIDSLPYADIITAGFPCKPFSVSGKEEGVADQRYGNLGYITYEIIKAKRPKAFMIENVKGLASKKHKWFLDELEENFKSIGYNVYIDILNAVNYEIPQKRERVFIIGILEDLDNGFKFPEQSDKIISIEEALEGLPYEPNDENNHYGYGLRNDEQPYAHKIPDGGNWKDLPIEDQKAFMKKAFYSPGGKTTYLRKVDPKQPAYTVMSHVFGKHSIQLYGNRRFTVRENLRLQTVPDWFSFDDSINVKNQYERCSGVPSVLAYKIMICIKEALNG
jgi:DNA (cytosine-5)-methyltransferase 1